MTKADLAGYRPLGPLGKLEQTERSVHLRSYRGVWEAAFLCEDLVRIRSSAKNLLPFPASWAVVDQPWPEVTARISSGSNEVALATAKGRVIVDRRTGAWRVLNHAGLEVFVAIPEETGFSKAGAQLVLSLKTGEAIFGLGETTGTFNKRGLIREFWNIDVLGHAPAIHPSLRTLYVSVPFGVMLHDGQAAGLFWDNPSRQHWDIGQTRLDRWLMKAAQGPLDLYLFLGPDIRTVVHRYTQLTGRIPMPPRWALGYHQCRYSYETSQRVEEIAAGFRSRAIPCDAIYLDIHHMDEYRVFTFGKSFRAPEKMLRKLRQNGFKTVAIVDPGVKDDRKFGVMRRGLKQNAFVKSPGRQTDFVGKVWPGESRFPDFMNARVRHWWGDEQAVLLNAGIAGVWNDMNEPANFASTTKTLPEDCVHESDAGPLVHSVAHNLYGAQMARASRDGALRHSPNLRPFVITRAGYAGVQRHALVWTGDNSSVWEHLSDAVRMFLNLGVSGLAFCGGDIGGFLDNTTPELLTRWTQMAAFTPFFRNHSNIRTIDQEPWALGGETEAICRKYIELRYQLLPYLYCLFKEAADTGAPIMRPMFWQDQDDLVAALIGDQFLLGHNLLVAPVLAQGAAARSVYLPRGAWFNYWTGEPVAGGEHVIALTPLDRIPLYVRAGALIPMGPVRQFVGPAEPNTLSLHVWLGNDGKLDWYEDDGETMEYVNGKFLSRTITLARTKSGQEITFGGCAGNYPSSVKRWRIILRVTQSKPKVLVNKRPVRVNYSSRFRACSFSVSNTRGPMTIAIRS